MLCYAFETINVVSFAMSSTIFHNALLIMELVAIINFYLVLVRGEKDAKTWWARDTDVGKKFFKT